MAVVLAAYHGPAQLTPLRTLTAWTLDLPVLVAVLAAGAWYVSRARQVRPGGQPWPARRLAAFLGGLGVLAVATMSFVGVYQDVLFYVRSVQVVLLLLVVPLFLALGRPLTLAAASPRLGRGIQAGLRGRAARLLGFPAIPALVLVVTPFLLYFTGWYEAGLRSGAVRELTFLVLIGAGLLFFWTLLRVDPVPRQYPYVVTLWVSAAEVIGDAILGLAVLADPNLIASAYYHALARPWGPGLHADQVLGGGALWVLGDLVGLPFLAAQLIQMIKEDEGEAARVDAELDASEAVPGPAGADGGTVAPAPAANADLTAPGPSGTGRAASGTAARPWWESDPRFAGRFQPPEPE